MSQRESRSPSYPQMSLGKCIDLLRRLYEGIHRGAVGNAEAQQIMGFAQRSGSGLAALSALKRFGLIEGRDPQIRITDLGFRLLEPMDARERIEATRTAALSPPIFEELLSSFGGKLPADTAIRAKLIREYGFTPAGVGLFIRSLRDTLSLIQHEDFDVSDSQSVLSEERSSSTSTEKAPAAAASSTNSTFMAAESGETLRLRVSPETMVTVSFSGPATKGAMEKLSALIAVLSENYG